MTILDYILNGIEAELALERELGVRSVACDRAVLAGDEKVKVRGEGEQWNDQPRNPETQKPRNSEASTASYDFVFLHDEALSADGVTMMAKIISAMGKTPESAPIIFTGELPQAKVYIVLGRNALKKWFPKSTGAPGRWIATVVSPNVLVTYSPEYILRFGTVTPSVQQLKREMWQNLKSVLLRVR